MDGPTTDPSPALLDRYLAAAHAAGCPADQLGRLLDAGLVLQPRQLAAAAAARACDAPDGPDEVGYGGARMGGKSHWMLAQIGADDCQRYPGLKALMLRKVGSSGRESFEDLLPKTLGALPHSYAASGSILTFANGSRIKLGHYKDERDVEKYLGLEYDVIGVEEATTLSAAKYRNISTCCRTTKPGWRARMYSTTNPGGIGHAWYKARFVGPHRDGAERHTRFVPATVRDNSFAGPDYRRKLEALSGWQRKAWLDGDWDIAAGQYFTSWRRDTHVVPWFACPAHWRVWLGLDYGFVHFTAAHLLAQSDDGVVYVLDEHAERRWLPERHAEGIRAMLGRNGVAEHRVEAILAGWDCFNRDRRGVSIADDYAALGLALTRADADRVNGAAELARRLGDPGDARRPTPATLFVADRCARLVECIPALEHDPNRGEDVLKVDCDDDGVGGDDAYDSARYALMYAAQGPAATTVANPLDGWRG